MAWEQRGERLKGGGMEWTLNGRPSEDGLA